MPTYQGNLHDFANVQESSIDDAILASLLFGSE